MEAHKDNSELNLMRNLVALTEQPSELIMDQCCNDNKPLETRILQHLCGKYPNEISFLHEANQKGGFSCNTIETQPLHEENDEVKVLDNHQQHTRKIAWRNYALYSSLVLGLSFGYSYMSGRWQEGLLFSIGALLVVPPIIVRLITLRAAQLQSAEGLLSPQKLYP
jgi:hypothetical protein